MNAPFFSLIIPVFNVAPYLPACLESLMAIEPRPDEIIVVDDGSTDEGPRILVEYAQRLPQMRIIRQENAGPSVARNKGLVAAQGKYLAFLDSDDFVSPAAYRQALECAERDDLEIVHFNGIYHFEGRQADRPIYADICASEVITGKKWLRHRLQERRLLHMVWLHLYRRDFIERQRLRFVPGLIHEDVIWTTQALLAANRMRYLDQCMVHYRIRPRIRSVAEQQAWLARLVDSSLINARAIAALAKNIDDDDLLARLLSWQAVDGAFSIFHKIEKMPDPKAARLMRARLLEEGLFPLLWQHAQTFAQRRRLARHYLKCVSSKWFCS